MLNSCFTETKFEISLIVHFQKSLRMQRKIVLLHVVFNYYILLKEALLDISL